LVSIGPFTLRNNIVLAPMAGVTDAPFRALAWRFGAGHVVGEMVGARDDLWNTQKSTWRRQAVAGVKPFAVQIAGGDPQTVATSAFRHWQEGAEVIDINFGCPAKKVCRKAAGSQLLKDAKLVMDIVTATVAAVPVPVTVKMRTGWALDMKNAPDLALRMEDVGVAALVVHGRTRACRFQGKAEHDTVATIASRASIPVFANGDICSRTQAQQVIDQTGVDGVMIGRGALGRPWLLGDIANAGTAERSLSEKLAVMVEHVRALQDFYGNPGIRIARKHVQWYVQHLAELGPETHRSLIGKEFNKLQEASAQVDFLQQIPATVGGLLAA
jgi:tRNA-dihydrouridine synthase B